MTMQLTKNDETMSTSHFEAKKFEVESGRIKVSQIGCIAAHSGT